MYDEGDAVCVLAISGGISLVVNWILWTSLCLPIPYGASMWGVMWMGFSFSCVFTWLIVSLIWLGDLKKFFRFIKEAIS